MRTVPMFQWISMTRRVPKILLFVNNSSHSYFVFKSPLRLREGAVEKSTIKFPSLLFETSQFLVSYSTFHILGSVSQQQTDTVALTKLTFWLLYVFLLPSTHYSDQILCIVLMTPIAFASRAGQKSIMTARCFHSLQTLTFWCQIDPLLE